MTVSARLVATARRILEEAGRPLNVRRILRLVEQEAGAGVVPTLDEVGAALEAGALQGLFVEPRRGIFGLVEGVEGVDAVAVVEERVEVAVARDDGRGRRDEGRGGREERGGRGEERGRRGRRRREEGAEPAGGPATPLDLDGTAEMSAQSDDREALKSKLWDRLRHRAAEVTDQPLAVAADEGGRRRGAVSERGGVERGAEGDAAGEDGARRRRRRREGGEGGEREAVPMSQAAEAARVEPKDLARAVPGDRDGVRDGGGDRDGRGGRSEADVKAALRARLARRGDEGEGVVGSPGQNRGAGAQSGGAQSAGAQSAGAEAGGGDARDVLKSRLAARLRGGGQEAPAAAVAAAAPVKAAAVVSAAAEAAPVRAAAVAAAAVEVAASARAAAVAAAAPVRSTAVAAAAPARAAAERAAAEAVDLKAAMKAKLAERLGGSSDKASDRPARSEVARGGAGEAARGGASEAARDPKSLLKARLAARSGDEAGVAGGEGRGGSGVRGPGSVEAVAAAQPVEPRAALKARLAQRAGGEQADPLEVPLADSRRPYREKRAESGGAVAVGSVESDRRAPKLPELSRTSTLVAAALAALRAAGGSLSLGELAARVDATAEGGAVGLRAALVAENARRDQAGLRAPFVVHYGGDVGLTEWGLSARYRALEAQVQEALAEQRELVRRDLLGRVGDLGDAAFEQVVVMLLERLGNHAVEVVHRQPGSVALTVSRFADGESEKVAVVARRSWNPINADTVRRLRDTLSHFEAGSGLVLTVGTFAATARNEARLDGQAHMRLIDGAGFAALLHEHGIGLASHQPVVHFVDVAFFESLER